jgi:PAS domain S-box-containing protein
MLDTNLGPLLHNTALLVSLVVVYDLATSRQRIGGRPLRQALVGVVLGLIGIGIMLAPLRFEPGIAFDTRSVLLAVSGLFLGAGPTAVAMTMTAAFRLSQGGAGAWTGVAVILASGGIGIAWRRYRRRPLEDVFWYELYALGVVVHVVMLALMLTLPWETGLRVLAGIGPPVLLVDPLATTALGALLASRLRRERVAAALEAADERWARMSSSHAVGVMLADAQGGIFEVNDYYLDLLGFTRAEFEAGQIRWDERTPPEHLAANWRAITELRERGICTPFEKEYFRKDGSRVWVLVADVLLPGPEERILAIIVDVTERKRAEEEARRLLDEAEASRQILLSVVEDQKLAEVEVRRLNDELEQRVRDRTAELQAANEELEAFSYSVSHDLRAPLRGINGFAGILAEDHGSKLDGEGQRVLGVISSEALRMGRLIDDLLRFSRLGRQPLRKTLTDMTALVREVQAEVSAQAPERAVDFRLDALPAAPADASLLRQVWFNLLDNAWKFTGHRDRAEIAVSGSSQGREVVYSVRDNGAGFEMKYVARLFGVFQRLHRTGEFEGTGVGLALVRRLVHRHGGRVWAEAEPDRGATFHFTLPLAEAEAATVAPAIARPPEG